MLLFALTLVLASAPQVDDDAQRVRIERASGAPQFAGVYHPRFGFREATDRGARFGPEIVWNAPQLSNYYSIPGAEQEWVDGGTLRRRHAEPREQFNSLEFTYCTSINPPAGLASTMRFYDEHVECRGPSAWPTANCSYGLSGLPGHSNANSTLSCWTVAVDLSGVECDLALDPVQNRMFGWSNTWENDDTGPWLTWANAPGVDNSFMWYDRVAMTNEGCWWHGGLAILQFDLRLWGQPPEVFAYTSQAGVGADMSLALEAHDTARAGASILFTLIDLTQGTSAEAPGMLFASWARADQDLQARFGIDASLLIDADQVKWRSFSSHGTHQSPTIPSSAKGNSIYVQGVQLLGARPTRLTAHALEMIVQ